MTPTKARKKMELPSMLLRYPSLAGDSNAIFRLALEEFMERLKNGERVDPQEFAARFPGCRSRLRQHLMFRNYTHDNADVVDNTTTELGEGLSDHTLEIGWPEAGDRIGGFNLLAVLGLGSFSCVYLARETALGGRLVALKVSREGIDRPDAAAEAEILGRLSHPGIVPIHSIQEIQETGFTLVCMPFLGDTTLAHLADFVNELPFRPRLARVILAAAAPQTAAEHTFETDPSPILRDGSYIDGVIELGIRLAEALAFVHERNIFHRDLKPSNVLVCPDGRPMLLDFNLSADDTDQGGKQFMGGSLLYMSPEQLHATDDIPNKNPCLLDARSDLFSLGVMLYELLAGDHPFGPWDIPAGKPGLAALRSQLLNQIPRGPRSLRKLNPLVDARLEGVLTRCIANKPVERFQSAADFAAALRSCLAPRWRLRRWALARPRWPMAAASVILFAATIFVLAAVLRLPNRERHFRDGIHALQASDYGVAVTHLSRALAEEESFIGRMARARACQKLGKFQDALDDFKIADELKASGHVKACIGYCLSRLETPNHGLAAAFYKAALAAGFDTAPVRNNLGLSLFQFRRSTLYDAKAHFMKAIRLDPLCQTAHFNRFKVELDALSAGNSRTKISREALLALKRTFQLGAATGEMHYDASRFLLLTKSLEPAWKEEALQHTRAAIMLGVRPSFSQGDDPAFLQVIRETPFGQPAARMSRTQDPFVSIGQ